MSCFSWKTAIIFWVILLASSAHIAHAQVTLLGPTSYHSFADSPFHNIGLSVFYLETFEDNLFNVPGVTAIHNTQGRVLAVGAPGFYADSVDGDDGQIDGLGRAGHSFCDANNLPSDNLGYTFRFNANVLGQLPTHVGIVWTDGSQTASTQLEVYGSQDELLGIVGPANIGNNSFAGETAEDRFFGAINNAGISRIVIRRPGGGNNLEVDHLQYGFVSSPVLISGIIALQETQNTVQSIDFTFSPTTDSPFTRTVTLNFAGGYSLPNIPADTYTVSIKGAKWLRKPESWVGF